jgi:hypothetical protein
VYSGSDHCLVCTGSLQASAPGIKAKATKNRANRILPKRRAIGILPSVLPNFVKVIHRLSNIFLLFFPFSKKKGA